MSNTTPNKEALAEVKSNLPDYLTRKGLPLNKPFKCLNPDHADRNPSMSYDRNTNRVHCFACNATYSLIDLVGIDYNISDDGEMIRKAYELYNIQTDDYTRKSEEPAAAPTMQETDFKRFFSEANKNIEKTDYHRGISLET